MQFGIYVSHLCNIQLTIDPITKTSTTDSFLISNLVYPQQTIPLLLHLTNVNDHNRVLFWRGKHQGYVYKLRTSKLDEGAYLPDIRVYTLACLSRHYLDWIHKMRGHFFNNHSKYHIFSPYEIILTFHKAGGQISSLGNGEKKTYKQ